MTSEVINNISGQIAGVNLSSFLQMIEMEQKTCTIKIFTKKNMGRIFFCKGELIDATTIHLKNADALYDILTWENIVIEVDENKNRRKNVINLPLMHLLMESARHSDETKLSSRQVSKSANRPLSRTIPLQVMRDENFCLELGIKLLIDFDDLDLSFRSSLVGIEPGRYLLIKAPGPLGPRDNDRIKSECMIIKTLYKGTIYVFRTRLIAIISKPSRLMFIEYPEKIEHHELRAHKRFKCSIVTQAQVNEAERNGVIENISEGGCLCVLETFPHDKDQNKNFAISLKEDTIPFRCRFPGSKGEISFFGEVRNARKKHDEIAVGIKFIHPESSEDVLQAIKNYIQLIEYSGQDV
jgi:hypothetical protein